MLVNIIGCDGAGKTTVIEYCAEWLRKEHGFTVEVLNKWSVMNHELFPECAFINCAENEIKNCISLMQDESRFLFLVYLYATSLMKMKDSVGGRETIILLDGYWYKHYASEILFGINKEWMKNICKFLPKPDFTILFDVDSTKSFERKTFISSYECGLLDVNQENYMMFQNKFRLELLALASTEQWEVIDANANLEDVISSTKRIFSEYISRLG